METIQFNFYKVIDILGFAVFVQLFEMSLFMFSMDGEANEVFYKAEDLFSSYK
ncbi:hypothetical protein [Bacillus cereus]|uniref:hypothetical protein n=1 Tax=Bacillus cereus TaxID=1396 RepID=UPI0015D496EE|nr:hypothetical protein [Bacillus cereus]